MKSFLLRASFAIPLSIFTFGIADAETRRLEFEIEPIIILNCVEKINYTIDTDQLLSAANSRAQSARVTGASNRSTKKINARFSADTVLNETNSAIVELDINNACSVRGLGRGEGFLVDVTAVDQGLLVNPNADGILKVNDARGKPHYSGHYANQFSIPQDRIRLDREIKLDVQLRVDMRLASGSGRYSSPVDGVFSIEVSAP